MPKGSVEYLKSPTANTIAIIALEFGRNFLETLIHPSKPNKKHNAQVIVIAMPSCTPDNEMTPGNMYCPGLHRLRNLAESYDIFSESGTIIQFKRPSKVPRQARKPSPESEYIEGGTRKEMVPKIIQIVTPPIVAMEKYIAGVPRWDLTHEAPVSLYREWRMRSRLATEDFILVLSRAPLKQQMVCSQLNGCPGNTMCSVNCRRSEIAAPIRQAGGRLAGGQEHEAVDRQQHPEAASTSGGERPGSLDPVA